MKEAGGYKRENEIEYVEHMKPPIELHKQVNKNYGMNKKFLNILTNQ